jgi:hypothetical protein
MAVLALVGITGMYLNQIRRNGLLGLVGYVLLASGYLARLLCAELSLPTTVPRPTLRAGRVSSAVSVLVSFVAVRQGS